MKKIIAMLVLALFLTGCAEEKKSPVLVAHGAVQACWFDRHQIDILSTDGVLVSLHGVDGLPMCNIFKTGGTWTFNYHLDEYGYPYIDWMKKD